MTKEYIALFESEQGENAYGVVFPDLPGCYSYGRDYDEAVRMAHEALSLYAEGEENMPEPRTLEQIKAQWEDWPEWENEYDFLIGKISVKSAPTQPSPHCPAQPTLSAPERRGFVFSSK